MGLYSFLMSGQKKLIPVDHSNEISGAFRSGDECFIFEKLTEVQNSRVLINVIPQESNDVFHSLITGIEKNHGFEIDCLPLAIQNNQLKNASYVRFSGNCHGIKFNFSSSPSRKKINADTLSFNWPSSIEWIQRREFYRTKIPLAHSGTYIECKASELGISGQSCIKMPILNLCSKGAALLIPKNVLLGKSVINKTLFGLIFLNNGQYGCINFQIKNEIKSNHAKKHGHQEFGCVFIDLSLQFQSIIQSYIQSIQIEDSRLAIHRRSVFK